MKCVTSVACAALVCLSVGCGGSSDKVTSPEPGTPVEAAELIGSWVGSWSHKPVFGDDTSRVTYLATVTFEDAGYNFAINQSVSRDELVAGAGHGSWIIQDGRLSLQNETVYPALEAGAYVVMFIPLSGEHPIHRFGEHLQILERPLDIGGDTVYLDTFWLEPGAITQ